MESIFENVCVVVPARIGSSRLSKKPLRDLCGKPMIVRVCENLKPLEELGAFVVVATDSNEIVKECEKFCINSKMTGTHHSCGTSRCFEAAQGSGAELVLNIQGDEPFLETAPVIELVRVFKSGKAKDFEIGTVAIRSSSLKDYNDPNKVKVVVDKNNKAMYFSRATIPYYRDGIKENEVVNFLLHQGVYLYRYEALERFCTLTESTLEVKERLEQLRAMEDGMSIYVHVSDAASSFGIDTIEDLQLARKIYEKRHPGCGGCNN